MEILRGVCSFALLANPLWVFAQATHRDWKVAGGGSENLHYSSLAQIDARNVKDLQIAWKYDSGDSYPGSDMQCNPIVIDGKMFAARCLEDFGSS